MRFTSDIPKQSWKPWFAWYPVFLEDGSLVWVEAVEAEYFGQRRTGHYRKLKRDKK